MKRVTLQPDPPTVSTVRNGHASNGRFAPGNRAASGRKSRSLWREAFDSACSPADLLSIVACAVADAKKGDARARDVVLNFCLQRPPRLIDVTTHEDEGSAPSTDPDDDYYA